LILLDTVNRSVDFILGGAVSTAELPFVATFADHTTTTFVPGANHGQSNGATPVTLVPAPAPGAQRQAKWLSIRNSDSAVATVTVRYRDSATARVLWSGVLSVGDTLQYADGEGFSVLDSEGRRKVTVAATAGTVTVEEVDGVPTIANVTTLRFDQADGFVVSSPGAGIARVDFTGGGATTAYRRWAVMFGD